MSDGWRVWLAFEAKPGIARAEARDRRGHWRGLNDACTGDDGRVDATEFDRWMTLMVEYVHLWADA
jgi:hypothetical protein